MKIKKFRIKPRLPVVGKILKSLLASKKLDPQLEESLPLEIQTLSSHLIPAAFSQTLPKDQLPPHLAAFIAEQNLDKCISVSIAVATAGTQLEDHLAESLMKGETTQAQIAAAVGEESADLALAFIGRLLGDDAASDGCELSQQLLVKEPELLTELFQLLEAHTENVTVDSAGHLSPRFTRVAVLAWWPVSKKKRAAVLPHKRAA